MEHRLGFIVAEAGEAFCAFGGIESTESFS
jgi:hypothetical protein